MYVRDYTAMHMRSHRAKKRSLRIFTKVTLPNVIQDLLFTRKRKSHHTLPEQIYLRTNVLQECFKPVSITLR